MENSKAFPKVVLVLGKTGVGKSTFIKTATGLDVETGDTLHSCTIPLSPKSFPKSMLITESGTAEVQIYPLPDSQTFFIDTPGFADSKRSDADILQSIVSCLADLKEGLTFAGTKIDLCGVIYMHAINQVRVDGPMMKNLRMLLRLVGNDNMKNLTYVTSKWSTEDVKVAEDREGELINDAKFWKDPITKGAAVKRFEDSKRSALEIVYVATKRGCFTPQLTREYVTEGKELCNTAAGRAIDEDLAKARDQQEEALATCRKEHNKALQTRNAQAAQRLRLQTLHVEAKLKTMDDETDQLRMTREEAQEQADELDLLISPEFCETMDWIAAKAEKRRARRKRAVRWFGRFAGLGAGIAISVLSHGAMVPVALALMGGIEELCQEDKKRDEERKKG
ncbi:hypothetical protein MMC28_001113 [Mycoblastus sanguinarius]|nr:hypothetical protein [Mycoblastus sanguinarius]